MTLGWALAASSSWCSFTLLRGTLHISRLGIKERGTMTSFSYNHQSFTASISRISGRSAQRGSRKRVRRSNSSLAGFFLPLNYIISKIGDLLVEVAGSCIRILTPDGLERKHHVTNKG